MKSTWHLVETASENLSFGQPILESGNVTKLMVGGGVFGGEYKIVNTVVTEEGTSLKCTICVTVTGCLTGGKIFIGDACSAKAVGHNIYPLVADQKNMIPSDAPVEEEKCILDEPGLYTKKDLMKKVGCECITQMTLVLITGEATYVDGTGSWPIEECGTTINNNGKCLDDFVLNISANSSVFFTKEGY